MKIKQWILTCLTIVYSAFVHTSVADEVLIGNYQLNLTLPKGFTLVTEGSVFDGLKRWEEPQVEYLGFLFRTKELQMVSDGVKQSFDKYHVLAVIRKLRYLTLPRQQFNILKNKMLQHRAPNLEDHLGSANEHLESTSKEINEGHETKMHIQTQDAYTLAPHVIGRNLIGQTTFIKYKLEVQQEGIGVEEIAPMAVTNTLVYVRGKVLNILSYATRSQTEWSRTASVGLAQTILEENSLSSDVEWISD